MGCVSWLKGWCSLDCCRCPGRRNSAASPDHDPPAAGLTQVNAPLENQHKDTADITLEDVDTVLAHLTAEVDRLINHSTSSSNTTSSVANSSKRSSILLQWEERKGNFTSFMKSFPDDLKKEVGAAGGRVIMPLVKSALGGVGGAHWLGLGLSFIAWSLDNIDKTIQNREDCLHLLQQTVRLLKDTREIWPKDDSNVADLQDTAEVAFFCALACTSNLTDNYLVSFLKAPSAKDFISSLTQELDRAHKQNDRFMMKQIYDIITHQKEQVIFSDSDYEIVGQDEVKKTAMAWLETESDDIHAVCLHGMGGIGKSTLGLSIYEKFQNMQPSLYSYRFCRVVLKLEVEDEKLHDYQNVILEDICPKKNIEYKVTDFVEGIEKLKQELRNINQPIFLYIDNALKPHHMCKLLPKASCFPRGSRLLVTTRNEDVKDCMCVDLKIQKCHLITVRKLNEEHARKLLWQKIRGSQTEEGAGSGSGSHNEELENSVLNLCDGLPLALQMVGGYIAANAYKPDPVDAQVIWKRVVDAMQFGKFVYGEAKDDIYHSLIKFSITELDDDCKGAFLDIAVFGENMTWDSAELLITDLHLDILQKRALVQKRKVPNEDWHAVEVHDMLKKAVRQLVAEDKLRIRITSQADLEKINRDSVPNVVGLIDVAVEACQLKQMSSLRILRRVYIQGECQLEAVHPKHLLIVEMKSETLRPLSFSECANLKELSWTCEDKNASNLEVVKFPQGLEILGLREWEGLENVDVIQTLTCLKELSLYSCNSVRSLPEGISNLAGLKKLHVNWCEGLQRLPEGVSRLTGLAELQVRGCVSLQCLPKGIYARLTSLTELDLCCCKQLQSLPEGVWSLTRMDLGYCESLLSIPEEIRSLTRLTELDLSSCEQLQSLPEGVWSLTGLTRMDLGYCKSLLSIPEEIQSLTRLTELQIRGCENLQCLPKGIYAGLTSLTELDLCFCKQLQSLPEAVWSLTGLTRMALRGCESLLSIPEEIRSLTGLTELDLGYCEQL